MPSGAPRSRSGCLTCLKRRKKCDEEWDAESGSCQRCWKSSYECLRGPPRVGSRKSATATAGVVKRVSNSSSSPATVPTAGPSGASAAPSPPVHSTSHPAAGPSRPTSVLPYPPLSSIPSSLFPPAQTGSNRPNLTYAPFNPPQGDPWAPPSIHASTSSQRLLTAVPHSDPSFDSPRPYPSHSSYVPQTSQQHYNETELSDDRHYTQTGRPQSPSLPQHSQYPSQAPPHQHSLHQQVWQQARAIPNFISSRQPFQDSSPYNEPLSHPNLSGFSSHLSSHANSPVSFSQAPARFLPVTGLPDSDHQLEVVGTFADKLAAIILSSKQNPSADDFNEDVDLPGWNDDIWHEGETAIPSDYAADDERSPESRNIYTWLNEIFFQSIPAPVRKVIVRRMDRLASSNALTRASSNSFALIFASILAETEEKRLDLEHRSNEAFKLALSYFDLPGLSLEAKLLALLDIQGQQAASLGSVAAHGVLLLGDLYITAAAAEQGGPITLYFDPLLKSASALILRAFAYHDVFRSISLPNQRTIITVADLPSDISPEKEAQYDEWIRNISRDPMSVHYGLPYSLFLCFAATSNLRCDMSSMDPGLVKLKAARIERSIRAWQGAVPSFSTGRDDKSGYSLAEELATQEMFKQAAIIYLYQAVHRVGLLSSVVQRALTEIIAVSRAPALLPAPLEPSHPVPYRSAFFVRALPYFMAATVAIRAEDREACRQGLRESGCVFAFEKECQAAAEKIWELTDLEGHSFDWRERLLAEGYLVAFL